MMLMQRFSPILVLGLLSALLTACGGGGGSASSSSFSQPFAGMAAESSAAGSQPQIASSEVPGLGTQAGRFRKSTARVTPFIRQRQSEPLEVVALYYNSEDGLKATLRMSGLPRGQRERFTSPRGYLEYALTSPRGKPLPSFSAQGRTFVVGEEGDNYALYIRNNTSSRVEVVMSVDGLDVIDRQPASYEKRGYILDPGEDLRVQGFRYSNQRVQAFRFGTVLGSLANQRYGAGGAANAGVVGFAIFPEAAGTYGYSPQDLQNRSTADPFPR